MNETQLDSFTPQQLEVIQAMIEEKVAAALAEERERAEEVRATSSDEQAVKGLLLTLPVAILEGMVDEKKAEGLSKTVSDKSARTPPGALEQGRRIDALEARLYKALASVRDLLSILSWRLMPEVWKDWEVRRVLKDAKQILSRYPEYRGLEGEVEMLLSDLPLEQ